MFVIILQMIISTIIICSGSLFISNSNFWYHLIFCAALVVLFIIGGIYRNEDRMRPGSGQRRYFMMFGQATVIAFFLGIILMNV
tara:strand:+ start:773 stop:1024 length:252 start_codon:yes stop_codon:yes gene_type:complete